MFAQIIRKELVVGLVVGLHGSVGCTARNPAWQGSLSDAGASHGDADSQSDVGKPEALPGSPDAAPPAPTPPDVQAADHQEAAAAPDARAVEAAAPADVAAAEVAPAEVAPADMAPAEVAPADMAPADMAPAGLSSIKMIGFSETPKQGGNGGTSFTDECGVDQAVIGYQGSIEPTPARDLIGSIQTLCGQLKLVGSAAGSLVQVTPIGTLARRGNTRALDWTASCPSDQAVVGYDGHSGVSLDQVRFRCQTLMLSADRRSIVFGPTDSVTASAGGDGGNVFRDDCPAGQIVHGSHTYADSTVRAFNLTCATPTPVP